MLVLSRRLQLESIPKRSCDKVWWMPYGAWIGSPSVNMDAKLPQNYDYEVRRPGHSLCQIARVTAPNTVFSPDSFFSRLVRSFSPLTCSHLNLTTAPDGRSMILNSKNFLICNLGPPWSLHGIIRANTKLLRDPRRITEAIRLS